MKMKYLIISLVISLSVLLTAQNKVHIAYIEGDIDLGLAPYISRVVSDAEKDNADAIIFKINTFGGRVDAATQIKDAIISSKILTIAFINNRFLLRSIQPRSVAANCGLKDTGHSSRTLDPGTSVRISQRETANPSGFECPGGAIFSHAAA